MPKFSVKKPYTILISVLIVLMLGIVSIVRMQLDLLPEMSLPYLLVITTYPGASPEKVESSVSEPMEASLGTITGVKNVYSFSYENYSMVELEFEDDTDMDSVLVKVSSAIDTLNASLPDECGTPSIMEISMDMMATMYTAVSYEGMDEEELSRFVEDTLNPQLERLDGVASISTIGLVDKTVNIELNQDKVDSLNLKILEKANNALADAEEQLNDAKQQLIDGQKELDDGTAKLNKSQKELDKSKADLAQSKADLQDEEDDTYEELAEASLALDQLSAHQTTLLNQKTQLSVLKSAIDKCKEGIAEGQAGVTQLSGLQTLVDACNANPTLLAAANATDPTHTNAEIIIGSLSAMGMDTTALYVAVSDNDAGAINTYLTTVSTALGAQITEANTKITEAQSLQDSYQSEYDALQVEIQVTQGIIDGYESKLEEMGVDYTDIEEAKLKAAAGFGSGEAQIAAGESALESAQAQIDSGKETLKSSQEQIDDGWDSYNDAVEEFEKQKETALKNANADELLTLSTLSQLIYAQNFEMPAGYIDDEEDNSWLLKVGDSFDSVDELEDMVLCHIDDIGDVTLGDVADLTIIDNSMDSYAKLNSDNAIILSIFKASTSGTNEVSKTLTSAIEELEEKYDGLDILIMMDQGDYIDLIVSSVVESMVLGAALAIVILAIFLKDFMPTIVVAISIPLSVLTALIAMYFSNISLNMMSLSGMALGIGMLVDNSVVVIENIYRLRGRGVSAPRAAVQGTKQVAGAVIASTLTSVCVFFPMVYTTGMVRELMLPMALTIIYCLLASLLVAMTVVPAASSTLLKNTKPKKHPFFDKVQDLYGKILDWCLKVKAVPLAIAIGLLGLSVWLVVRMGIVMIPDITTNQIQVSVSFDEDEITRDEAYASMDTFMYDCTLIDGVDSVGAMMGGTEALMASTTDTSYESFSVMVTTENENAGATEVKQICSKIEDAAESLGLECSISTGMEEMTEMLGNGLSVSIYGDDPETLLSISDDVMEMVDSIDGYTEISNGQEDADDIIHLYIDKTAAMEDSLTVAQIYQAIAAKMTTEATAVTVTIDGVEMDVKVVDNLDPLTYENLMDLPFEVTKTNDDGEEETVEKPLSDYATIEREAGLNSIQRQNQSRYITVSASVEDGYNTTLLTRKLQPLLDAYECPEGYSIELGGEYDTVVAMVKQMGLILLLGIAFIYFIMVAQFQSLLSPFIVLFTIPLAFTGGLLALWITGENISMIALMGFVVLTGTVVNNGIVYVDYTNQLRMGGMERHDALIATGKTRMRPILMTALTTILAESSLIFGDDMGSQMGRGMALVIAGGLLYATLMTLFIIPVMYDMLFKKPPLNVDTGSENLDDVPDDAAEFIAELNK